MDEGDDKQPLIPKKDGKRHFTRFNRRSYEVYGSFKEFIHVADPMKREPERVKSLSFKKRRISQFAEATRNIDGIDGNDSSQGRFMVSRSQPDLCTGCNLSITHNDDLIVQLHEELYHVYCFQCIQCGNKIDPKVDYILIEDGKPLCGSCIPECHACGETILSKHVHVIDKDFHEQCLLCTFCRKVIDSQIITLESDGFTICNFNILCLNICSMATT